MHIALFPSYCISAVRVFVLKDIDLRIYFIAFCRKYLSLPLNNNWSKIQTLHVSFRELEESDCAALRNNLVVMMADFCVQYTTLVDW